LAYLLVLPGSRARIVRCGGRYDPQLVKRSSEWVSEWWVVWGQDYGSVPVGNKSPWWVVWGQDYGSVPVGNKSPWWVVWGQDYGLVPVFKCSLGVISRDMISKRSLSRIHESQWRFSAHYRFHDDALYKSTFTYLLMTSEHINRNQCIKR